MQIADILGSPHAYDLFPASADAVACLAMQAPETRAPETRAPETQNDTAAEAILDKKTETIVFLHGWLLSRTYWQPLVSQLSGYQRLTYDMRGFGESAIASDDSNSDRAPRTIPLPQGQSWHPSEPPYTNDGFSLAAYAQDLAALLDELNLERVWLMGHSLGGSVALWAAYLFPEKVKGVICLNAGGGIYIPKAFEKFRGAGQQMVKYRPQWLTTLPVLSDALSRVFTRAMVHKTLELKWGKQRLHDFICADRAAAEGALLASTTQEEVLQLPQLMGALSQPVHFITATQDSIMPPRYVNYLASFHPDFNAGHPQDMVSEIADCGHMAMVEQPDAVAAVVKAVVSDRDSASQAPSESQLLPL